MLGRLVEFSLTQRVLVLVAAAGLALAGALAFLKLPVDAYPDIAPTQVKLILKAPGMTPEEVESRVVAPLELELLGLPNGTMLRSTAKYAIADITLDFLRGHARRLEDQLHLGGRDVRVGIDREREEGLHACDRERERPQQHQHALPQRESSQSGEHARVTPAPGRRGSAP